MKLKIFIILDFISMARIEHYYTKLEEGNFYHIYNRAVERRPMFTENRNYQYFLSKIVKYLIPFLDVYAYCLLDNHFHLLVKVKEFKNCEAKDSGTLKELPNLELPKVKLPNLIVSGAFRRMFQSYAMAFNRQENRIGTLFQEPFKRSLVDSEEYLMQLIFYIHFNPQKHGLIADYRNYPYSSFQEHKNQVAGFCVQQKTYELFGGYFGYLEFHNSLHDAPKQKYIIEID